MPEHIFKMAPNCQPPYQHSYLLDNDRLFAESRPLRVPPYGTNIAKYKPSIPDTEDFEIDWPVLDKYADELDTEVPSTGTFPSTYTYKKPGSHHKSHHRSPLLVPDSRSFINTTSRKALLPRISASMKAPSPAPLVLSVSAFKRDNLGVPPAPPPSPILTPPPTPPFCPLYEEHQTLGAFDIPAIAAPKPVNEIESPKSQQFVTYSSFENMDTEEDHKAVVDTASSYLVDTATEYDSAPPPPSIQLYRTISQPGTPLHIPRQIFSAVTLCPSRSSPCTPIAERTFGKSELSSSFFEWDPEPETTPSKQWTKLKHSKYRNIRRGSDSDESHTSKISVREKAERLRRKLESVFGKKHPHPL